MCTPLCLYAHRTYSYMYEKKVSFCVYVYVYVYTIYVYTHWTKLWKQRARMMLMLGKLMRIR